MITIHELNQFYCTEQYHYSPLYHKIWYTDGVKYLYTEGQCYWLHDQLATKLVEIRKKYPNEYFVIFTLDVNLQEKTGELLTERDKDDSLLPVQTIPYTDFPLPVINLYAQYNGEQWVIMLTSEY